mmetsp:Transcript_11437/g.36116  ORF Transcript_11437/g.36116 Transcript_11437/m.36116 type:complete len:322 (+) Transcript_11437:188-1153(+)|eukprot:CAMPEP_0182906856 /NCGR_PEP_ID=MMETSP0034_2-20130328/34061_1 /TAXON_ID=156128 /ORGANISM="Nephroselmis pyriformis, Strain CCMP717" /LENGTH=321 /DNA_ID=CAMNT_0025042643 /DNA_START=140 /DNA_END=1105 /DNA_ORIENTATION=+
MASPPPIKYVLIPCDESRPIQELALLQGQGNGGGGGDPLGEHLKSVFAAGPEVTRGALERQYGKAVASGADLSTFSAGGVETFAVGVAPRGGASGATVYFFLDECGALRGARRNVRACGLAEQCGFVPMPFPGDVYVARRAGGGAYGDFTLQDMSSGSEWMRLAAGENYRQSIESKALHAQLEEKGMKLQNASGAGKDGSLPSGHTSRYVWTQTEQDLEVAVRLPGGAAKGDVKVKFSALAVEVHVRGEQICALGPLVGRVVPDECTWTMGDPPGSLVLQLEKQDAGSWQELETGAPSPSPAFPSPGPPGAAGDGGGGQWL